MVDSDGVVSGVERGQIPTTNPGLDGCLDEPRDRAEFDLTGNEGRDRDLIRGIEDGGCATACTQGFIGQAKSGKPSEIRSLEGELADPGKVELCRRTLDAFRPSQAMRNRRTHVGCAKLSNDRAIRELYHAVDDRLRM